MARARRYHTHRFIKITNPKIRVWRCAVTEADCAYALYEGQEQLLVGRKSLCWNCGREFIMTEENLTQERPICILCDVKENNDGQVNIIEVMNRKVNQPEPKKEPGRANPDIDRNTTPVRRLAPTDDPYLQEAYNNIYEKELSEYNLRLTGIEPKIEPKLELIKPSEVTKEIKSKNPDEVLALFKSRNKLAEPPSIELPSIEPQPEELEDEIEIYDPMSEQPETEE